MAKSLVIDGLKDAVRHARGTGAFRAQPRVVYVVHPVDVRAIRMGLGLTQGQFAKKFGFSLATVRNWEQKRRHPKGAQMNLLRLIEAMPDEVERVLCNAA